MEEDRTGGWSDRARGWAAIAADDLRRLLRVVDERIRPPRLRTTAALILFGAALVGASKLLGLDSVFLYKEKLCQWDTRLCAAEGIVAVRQVGFLSAPNWSLTAVIIWPAMFYVLRSLLNAAECVFREIDESPMGWLNRGNGGQTIARTWAGNKIYLRRWAALFVIAAVAASVLEWRSESALPLTTGKIPKGAELDWSLVPVEGLHPHVQAAFSLAAFLYQAVAIALMATFAAAVILIARTMAVHGSGDASPPLLVDIESNDPSKRGGFERFVIVIDYMIVFVGLAFANFFLTRVQNAYLRDFNHANFLEIIQEHFVVLETKDIGSLFDVGFADYSSAAVAIGGVLALFQCFFFFNATLRHVALQARTRADHALVRSPLSSRAASTGIDRDKVRERLREMNVWPLGYSDLMPTLSFLTICAVTIVFYRIGIYLVFLWIAGWIIARAAQGLIRGR